MSTRDRIWICILFMIYVYVAFNSYFGYWPYVFGVLLCWITFNGIHTLIEIQIVLIIPEFICQFVGQNDLRVFVSCSGHLIISTLVLLPISILDRIVLSTQIIMAVIFVLSMDAAENVHYYIILIIFAINFVITNLQKLSSSINHFEIGNVNTFDQIVLWQLILLIIPVMIYRFIYSIDTLIFGICLFYIILMIITRNIFVNDTWKTKLILIIEIFQFFIMLIIVLIPTDETTESLFCIINIIGVFNYLINLPFSKYLLMMDYLYWSNESKLYQLIISNHWKMRDILNKYYCTMHQLSHEPKRSMNWSLDIKLKLQCRSMLYHRYPIPMSQHSMPSCIQSRVKYFKMDIDDKVKYIRNTGKSTIIKRIYIISSIVAAIFPFIWILIITWYYCIEFHQPYYNLFIWLLSIYSILIITLVAYYYNKYGIMALDQLRIAINIRSIEATYYVRTDFINAMYLDTLRASVVLDHFSEDIGLIITTYISDEYQSKDFRIGHYKTD